VNWKVVLEILRNRSVWIPLLALVLSIVAKITGMDYTMHIEEYAGYLSLLFGAIVTITASNSVRIHRKKTAVVNK